MARPDWFDFKAPDYDRVWRERGERLLALRAEPQRWEGIKAHYRDNIADFINDWGCTYDPRNAGQVDEEGSPVPTTLPFILFPRQEEFVTWLLACWKNRENGLVEKSRDMGISWTCVAACVGLWLFHEGFRAGFGSRKEDLVDKIGDPDCLFWKMRMLVRMLPKELQPVGYDEGVHAPHMRLLNPENGAAITGEAGKNIGRGGRTSIYIKDESAFYEQPSSIDAALSQTTNCSIDVSTPNGEGNPFWRKRHDGSTKVFVFDWRQDPRKGKEWYAVQVAKLTKVELAAEVDRDYSASVSNAWIDSQRVTQAMQRGPAQVRPFGPLMVGLDVARFGDDSNVLTFRRGRVVLKQVKWSKSDTVSTAGRARQEILAFKEKPGQIAIDVIGLGAGVADMMRNFDGWKDIVVDVNSSLVLTDGENYNLRAYMWRQMKDWLELASVPNDQQLRVSLTALRYFFKAGALLIESKDDAKKRGIKSPDEADSLALTFAYPPKARDGDQGVRPDQVVSFPAHAETGM